MKILLQIIIISVFRLSLYSQVPFKLIKLTKDSVVYQSKKDESNIVAIMFVNIYYDKTIPADIYCGTKENLEIKLLTRGNLFITNPLLATPEELAAELTAKKKFIGHWKRHLSVDTDSISSKASIPPIPKPTQKPSDTSQKTIQQLQQTISRFTTLQKKWRSDSEDQAGKLKETEKKHSVNSGFDLNAWVLILSNLASGIIVYLLRPFTEPALNKFFSPQITFSLIFLGKPGAGRKTLIQSMEEDKSVFPPRGNRVSQRGIVEKAIRTDKGIKYQPEVFCPKEDEDFIRFLTKKSIIVFVVAKHKSIHDKLDEKFKEDQLNHIYDRLEELKTSKIQPKLIVLYITKFDNFIPPSEKTNENSAVDSLEIQRISKEEFELVFKNHIARCKKYTEPLIGCKQVTYLGTSVIETDENFYGKELFGNFMARMSDIR